MEWKSGISACSFCYTAFTRNPLLNNYDNHRCDNDGDNDGILGNVFGSPKPSGSIALNGTATVVPIPAAVWLFASELFGLTGFIRKNKLS